MQYFKLAFIENHILLLRSTATGKLSLLQSLLRKHSNKWALGMRGINK